MYCLILSIYSDRSMLCGSIADTSIMFLKQAKIIVNNNPNVIKYIKFLFFKDVICRKIEK